MMIVRQLFEPLSSTYTYLLGCEETAQAILIDPVIVTIDRDLAELKRLGRRRGVLQSGAGMQSRKETW